MFYTSMDFLDKLYNLMEGFFQIRFRMIGQKKKNEKRNQTNRGGNIDQSAMCYINGFVSTSSNRQMKSFLQISNSFFELTTFFLNNSAVWCQCMHGVGGICADKTTFQFNYASPSSGEAYRDRRLTTNFELWGEIFVCRHVSILSQWA